MSNPLEEVTKFIEKLFAIVLTAIIVSVIFTAFAYYLFEGNNNGYSRVFN